MNKLVLNNLLHRPLRTAISVFAVAIEVVMILSIVAIMFGMLNDQKTRISGIGADMIVRPANASFISAIGGAPAPVRVADVLRKVPHVEVVAPVITNLSTAGSVETIWGIDYPSYNALKPFEFVSGGPFEGPNDVIIDDYYARADNGHKVGDSVKILNHDFRISGIVEHGKGGRKFLRLDTLGSLMGSDGHATLFYLKSDNIANQELIRKELKVLPGMSEYQVQTMDEWLSLMTPAHLPAFTTALYTVIWIAVIVGFLVIFQSMYTAVMERTREIGILKSLGASKGYIVGVVLRETFVLSIAGVVLGIALTLLLRAFLSYRNPTFSFQLTSEWMIRGAAIAFAGAFIGAVYPALKAAHKDPIDALAYE